MKTMKKVVAVTVALVMLLAMTACGGYKPASKYTNVTIGGLKMDIRSDMKFDDSQKNAAGEKVEGYYCDYFGISVTSESATKCKIGGVEDTEAYLNVVIDQNRLDSKVETSNGNIYIDYTKNVSGTEYAYRAYGLDIGYKFYMVQFFCKNGEQDQYVDEYEKILGTVELAEVPAETQEIVISNIKMTVSGEVEKLNDSQYYGSKYFISALRQKINFSAKDFADAMIKTSNFKTADGQTPVVTETADGIATFEDISSEQHVYSYVKSADGYIVYIMFIAPKALDDAAKAECLEIIKNATVVD